MIVYTPRQVGEILGSAPETVIRWIREGQLKASNLATGRVLASSSVPPMSMTS